MSRFSREEFSPVRLQGEICRAGATTDLVRVMLAVGFWCWLAILPLLGVLFLSGLGPARGPGVWFRLGVEACLGLVGAWFAASAFAFPLAAAYRHLRAEQLRRKLAALPQPQLAEVLLPLREYHFPDTRSIVEALVRELRPEGTELCPARAPAGRGTEAAGAPPG